MTGDLSDCNYIKILMKNFEKIIFKRGTYYKKMGTEKSEKTSAISANIW